MHNVLPRNIKVAQVNGEQNLRKIFVAGRPWGFATQQYGSWLIEAIGEDVCAHADSVRDIRHVVAVATKEYA